MLLVFKFRLLLLFVFEFVLRLLFEFELCTVLVFVLVFKFVEVLLYKEPEFCLMFSFAILEMKLLDKINEAFSPEKFLSSKFIKVLSAEILFYFKILKKNKKDSFIKNLREFLLVLYFLVSNSACLNEFEFVLLGLFGRFL